MEIMHSMKKVILTIQSACLSFLLFSLTGCADPEGLRNQIKELNNEISEMLVIKEELTSKLNSCNKLTSDLTQEKEERHKNLTSLKAKTRRFIKEEYNFLGAFSKSEELMDYKGGELIERTERGGSDLTILNMTPLPLNSVIYSIDGFFYQETTFSPQLFRLIEEEWICVWQGPYIHVQAPGLITFPLETPLNAVKGDIFGFYFPDDVAVSFSERTGTHTTFSGKVDMGEEAPSRFKATNRSYSIGISGFIE